MRGRGRARLAAAALGLLPALAPGGAGELKSLSPAAVELLVERGAEPSPEHLRVRLAGVAPELPDVAGKVEIAGGRVLRFTPAFPFSPRESYRLIYAPPGGRPLDFPFALDAADDAPRAEVAAIYPSGEVLPVNTLRFYIHFTAPMSRGEAFERIHLLDGEGAEIHAPFLELAEELWDAEGKRFTLLLDPGRVKRGLVPHETAGPPLAAGTRYTLLVDAAWRDAQRRPLAAPARKGFRTGPADRAMPDPAGWGIEPPGAGGREPLTVRFGEALDRALALRLIEVKRAGAVVPGEVALDDGERVWRFTPERDWQAGEYRLSAGSELEDVCGNSVRKPFEVTADNPARPFTGPTVDRAFAVGRE